MTFNSAFHDFRGHDIFKVKQIENGTIYSYTYDGR